MKNIIDKTACYDAIREVVKTKSGIFCAYDLVDDVIKKLGRNTEDIERKEWNYIYTRVCDFMPILVQEKTLKSHSTAPSKSGVLKKKMYVKT